MAERSSSATRSWRKNTRWCSGSNYTGEGGSSSVCSGFQGRKVLGLLMSHFPAKIDCCHRNLGRFEGDCRSKWRGYARQAPSDGSSRQSGHRGPSSIGSPSMLQRCRIRRCKASAIARKLERNRSRTSSALCFAGGSGRGCDCLQSRRHGQPPLMLSTATGRKCRAGTRSHGGSEWPRWPAKETDHV